MKGLIKSTAPMTRYAININAKRVETMDLANNGSAIVKPTLLIKTVILRNLYEPSVEADRCASRF
jgi:hypothetical protein